MKITCVLIALVCILLIGLLALITMTTNESNPPKVNTEGLVTPTKVIPAPTPTPVCYTQDDVYIMAQVMSGECYETEYDDMLRVGMTICNRVDDSRFPNTVAEVVKQPGQIHGYSPYTTPSENYLKAAAEVLDNWNAIKNGEDRSWEYGILFWSAGGGTVNVFRGEY